MKPFTAIAVIFFALVAVLQLARFMLSWEVTVNGMIIPVWASGIAFLFAVIVAVQLWREAHR